MSGNSLVPRVGFEDAVWPSFDLNLFVLMFFPTCLFSFDMF